MQLGGAKQVAGTVGRVQDVTMFWAAARWTVLRKELVTFVGMKSGIMIIIAFEVDKNVALVPFESRKFWRGVECRQRCFAGAG